MDELRREGLVSVIIPTIGRQPRLPPLIDALVSGTRRPIEVIVSHSGHPQLTLDRSDVLVLHHASRLLASAARNCGADRASGDYLFFLDDDNELAAGAVDVLARVLDDDAAVTEVGPAMFYAGDRGRVYSLGVTHGRFWNNTTWHAVPPRGGSRLVASDALPNAFMVRRRQFTGVGGFDEVAFPMDFEESDLAFRLRRRYGGRVVCSLDATVWHDAPLAMRSRLAPKSRARCFYSARNRPIFIARHCGWLPWIAYLAVGQWVAFGSKLVGIHQPEARRVGSRRVLTVVYARGMVAGAFRSVLELHRDPGVRP